MLAVCVFLGIGIRFLLIILLLYVLMYVCVFGYDIRRMVYFGIL